MENVSLEKKEEIVRRHYERAYQTKLRKLTPEEILDLYKELKRLIDTEFFEKKRN